MSVWKYLLPYELAYFTHSKTWFFATKTIKVKNNMFVFTYVLTYKSVPTAMGGAG